MVEHLGIAPSIPVWKVLADGVQRVSLNTYARAMKLESRARVALAWTVLQTAAWAARPTGHETNGGRKPFRPPVITHFLLKLRLGETLKQYRANKQRRVRRYFAFADHLQM